MTDRSIKRLRDPPSTNPLQMLKKTRLKLGAWNIILVFYVGGKLLDLHLLCLREHTQEAGSEAQVGIDPRHTDMGSGHPELLLNALHVNTIMPSLNSCIMNEFCIV